MQIHEDTSISAILCFLRPLDLAAFFCCHLVKYHGLPDTFYSWKSLISHFDWDLMTTTTYELYLTAALWLSELLLFMLQLMHTKGDGPEQSSRGENPCVGISLCCDFEATLLMCVKVDQCLG